MPLAHAPVVETQPAWMVCISPANLRLLQACVSWLQQAQRDPDIRQQLASVRSQLQSARPITVGSRPPCQTPRP